MLETAFAHQFTFDAVQMPLNVMDAHYDSFEKKVLPVLVKHNIGVLGMKPMGDSIILRSKTASAVECLHYAMNLPTSVVITGCESLPILQQALDAARSFKPWARKKSPSCWPEPRLLPVRESTNSTRQPTTSTGRTKTRSGWVRTRTKSELLYSAQVACNSGNYSAGAWAILVLTTVALTSGDGLADGSCWS